MDFIFLKSFLKQHKITRKQFANDIGIPIGTVNTWFYRKPENIPPDIAVKIASIYQIPLDKLIGGEAASGWFFSQLLNGHTYGIEHGALVVKQPSAEERQKDEILNYFDSLNEKGKSRAIENVRNLTFVPEYKKTDSESEMLDDEGNVIN